MPLNVFQLQRSVDSGVPKNVILMCYLIQNGANEKLMNKKRQDAVHQLDSDARLYVQRYTDQYVKNQYVKKTQISP